MKTPAKIRNLIVTRRFKAPIEAVWRLWTEPGLIMRWWGPDNFTCPSARIDFREGGTSIVCMRAPKEFGGQDFYNRWTYSRIVSNRSIEFVMSLCDRAGNVIDPITVNLPPEFPEATRTLVTFADLGGGVTEMTVTEFDMPTSETPFGKNAELGLNQSVDKMFAIFSAVKE